MALYSMAIDLQSRKTIWVAQTVVKHRPQLNSHTSDCYQRDGIDGFEAYELAGLHTDYRGNNWEEKYVAFVEKWSEEVEVSEAATVG
jgi:hypothetical protein